MAPFTVHPMKQDRNRLLGETFSALNHLSNSFLFYISLTFKESVVILMEGFLAVTAVLEPHLLFLPALALLAVSASPSELTTPGDGLLPEDSQHTAIFFYFKLNKHCVFKTHPIIHYFSRVFG